MLTLALFYASLGAVFFEPFCCISILPKISYYSYKDLDLFIVTQNTTYESFKRIHRVLYNSYPVRVMQDGYIQEIETYSEHFQDHFTAFSLQDRIIYIDVKT